MSNLISNDYIAGFVDGEGMFYIGIVKSTKTGRNERNIRHCVFYEYEKA